VDVGRSNVGFKKRRGMRDNRNRIVSEFERDIRSLAKDEKKVVRIEVLSGQNAIHRVEGKLAAAVEKVGKMGLPEAGLAGKERDTQRPPLDSAEQFESKAFVHLREIHVWKICHQQ